MAKVHLAEGIQFFIGVVDKSQFVNKPSRALGIRVEQRQCSALLQRQDKVAGVEHVEHREQSLAVNLCHIALRLDHGIHGLLHFGPYVGCYQFVVSAQFGRMIAADAVMEI